MRPVITLSLLAALAGCSPATHTRPTEMSAAEHDREAKAHEEASRAHAEAFDEEAARKKRLPCALQGSRAADAESPCWSEMKNPTAAHREAAEREERRAAEHRAAAAVLRDAEDAACQGFDQAQRDAGPFGRPEHVAKVELLASPASEGAVPRGALVTFAASSGFTVERLQKLADCHLARIASAGHAGLALRECPLEGKAITAVARSTPGGVVLEIRSQDPEMARGIQQRAQRVVASPPPSPPSGR